MPSLTTIGDDLSLGQSHFGVGELESCSLASLTDIGGHITVAYNPDLCNSLVNAFVIEMEELGWSAISTTLGNKYDCGA